MATHLVTDTSRSPVTETSSGLAGTILPLDLEHPDYDALIAQARDRRVVLIGEASHGTEEFYQQRAFISQRLIEEAGFHSIIAEADWPDAYQVNRFVRNELDAGDPMEALAPFSRFPTWMWRNRVTRDFILWLRQYNRSLPKPELGAGFYGMDLYSLGRSIEAVLAYLDKVDSAAAGRARERYGCFDHIHADPHRYGYAANLDLDDSCEAEVIQQLCELQEQSLHYLGRDGQLAADDFFFAERNARLVQNAERYYRAVYESDVSSWNIRDQHMAETVDALLRHLDKKINGRAKVILWAHNSHLGNARATEMSDRGEWNVGQLLKEGHRSEAFSIGFTTYSGTVLAVDNWGDPPAVKAVRPGLKGSYEELFHQLGRAAFQIHLRGEAPELDLLRSERLERAIGVIYRPETERFSHYFYSRLPDQFDWLIHIDQTRALEALDPVTGRGTR